MSSPAVPVTVISGFVGAGKTTLLDRLLADTKGARVGVVASDPSAAGFARARGAVVRLARPRLVEMRGGRLCCSQREDVRQELCGLATAGGFDRLLVASDGLAEPLPVAQTLVARGDDGKRLLPGLRLDALVTVVDARALLDECDRDDTLRERGLATHPRDDRRVLEVIVDQVGSSCGAQAFSPWWAAAPGSLWPIDKAGLARIESAWDERLGDRRQELVFIGRGMDEGGLRHGLDRCLLSEAELSLGASGWAGFHDPFPSWTGRVPAEAPDRAPRCLQ